MRKHRLQRFTQRFFSGMWLLDFRFYHLVIDHFRRFRQRNQQALNMGRVQRQRTILPLQAGGEVEQRYCGVINFDIDIVQAKVTQRDGVWRADVSVATLLFRRWCRRRHFLAVDHHADIAQGDIVNAHGGVQQAVEIHRQMNLPGIDADARHFVTQTVKGQVTPATIDLFD